MSACVAPSVMRMDLRTLGPSVFLAEFPWVKKRVSLRASRIGFPPPFDVNVESITIGAVACERLTPFHYVQSCTIIYGHDGRHRVGSSATGLARCSRAYAGDALAEPTFSPLPGPWHGVAPTPVFEGSVN